MAKLRHLIWRTLGRSRLLAWAPRRLAPNPFRWLRGKPLERWLLTYDLGPSTLALSNDLAIVTQVMQDRDGVFPKSAAVQALLRPLVGEGVFGQPGGAAVKETRRLYNRALAEVPDSTIQAVTRTVVDRYAERWLATGLAERLSVCTELSRLTVDIVAECTLGTTFDTAESTRFADLFFEYHRRAVPLTLLLGSRGPHEYAHLVDRMGLAATGAAMRQLIRQRFVDPLLVDDSPARRAPFAAALIDAGLLGTARGPSGVPDEAAVAPLIDEIGVMLLAGHETTASTLSWLLWELAQRPEQRDAAADLGADAESWLKALIKEALRLYPPIAFYLRDVGEDQVLRGKCIARGSFFVIAPWTLHRHRALWSAPDAFRPERWLGQEPPPPRGAFIPFGMGPRTCPGAHFADIETVEILDRLLARFDLVPAMTDEPHPLGSLTSRPDREIYLQLLPRAGAAG